MREVRKLKRLLLILLLPISLGLLSLAKYSSYFAEEIFAKRIYHHISVVGSILTGFFSYSIIEIIVFLLPAALITCLICFIIHIVKDKTRRGVIVLKAVINIACVLSVGFFLYTIGCGINYYRYSFCYYDDLEVMESTEEELEELYSDLTQQANQLRAQISSVDENGVYEWKQSKVALAKLVQEAYDEFAKEYPILKGNYAQAKPVRGSELMSRMEITGMFMPFTMEANVNVAIPDYSIASTMAHEMSHVRGFMREDEANYLAYLVCLSSSLPEIQYSGVMQALITTGNALYKKDPERYDRIAKKCSEAVRKDIHDNSIYWKQYENTVISNTAEKVNNSYLQANNQQDGTQSYGRMVDLLLARQRKLKKTEGY